ncbi:TrlF family AAA-like ATPase, partial [Sulfitobacter sp. HGT1]|uniref:TrlF family AAA-like ATPase n=1 Tax=Sulfitobacter sp. HGT1 TaxID=2735435 RepID=UPI0015932E6E
SQQRHDLYTKYHDQDSKIRDLLGECGVNMHLMVSPEDPDHLEKAKAFVRKLRFRAHDEPFTCTRDDLIRLGRASDPSKVTDELALEQGATQFKVGFDQLRDEFDQSRWAQENILVAVAGGKDDGTSGVKEAADATLRTEIEKFADIIFASSAAQREFWLGLRAASPEELISDYGSLKPCMHGSDSHETRTVGRPDGNRFSWIKGGLEFDALRQACIDPSGRAFVGEAPPSSGTPSQLIDGIELVNAPWANTPKIAFNHGLVAVIGARGSGKTALADIIASVCDATPQTSEGDHSSKPSPSFLSRAIDLLGDAKVKATWRAGEPTTRFLDGRDQPDVVNQRARYLSQQFVEDLCSADMMTDGLLREIERVIYEAHTLTDREGALDFRELLELKSARFRHTRRREEETIVNLSDRISIEYEQVRKISKITTDIDIKEKLIGQLTEDRGKLVVKGSEARMGRLNDLSTAAETVRGNLRFFNQKKSALDGLADDVKDLRFVKAPEMLRVTQERHKASQMKDSDWNAFQIDYTGDVDAQIAQLLSDCEISINSWKGVTPPSPATPETLLIPEDAELERQPLALLQAEIARLERLVAADEVTKKQFSALTSRISIETTSLTILREKLQIAQGARARISELQAERDEAYSRVFSAVISEQRVLTELYEPLLDKLSGSTGSLKKMSFTVSRSVDVDRWADFAEKHLIDLRRDTPFKGAGTFLSLVNNHLKAVWETGGTEAVGAAMASFRTEYMSALLEHTNVTKSDENEYRDWLKRFAKWLYSTDHISLQYGIDFDGVDIRKLSPGTRGIVLLLLYLALDDADTRPLIIDQPEENLDCWMSLK